MVTSLVDQSVPNICKRRIRTFFKFDFEFTFDTVEHDRYSLFEIVHYLLRFGIHADMEIHNTMIRNYRLNH